MCDMQHGDMLMPGCTPLSHSPSASCCMPPPLHHKACQGRVTLCALMGYVNHLDWTSRFEPMLSP
jgi:hypothetical protein